MKKLLYIWILSLISVLATAQATGVPYECNFEESEDLSAWVLNYGTPTAKDKWMVGDGAHSEGRRSLYISIDGKNPSYGSQPNVVASYMRYKFPEETAQKNYDLSFDWRSMGDTTSCLYVMVCPEVLLTNISANNNYNLDRIVSSTSGLLSPAVAANACQQFGAQKVRGLHSSETWQNVSTEVKVSSGNSKNTFAIVFIWVNNNHNETITNTGICVDNIQIASATIKKPYNVTVEPICHDSTMRVSWECAANEYEVQYRKVGTGTWRRADGLTDGSEGFTHNGTHYSYILHRIMEGTYDVRVRAKAGTLTSNFTYKNGVLVYCPENHCVDYIHFHDNPRAVCTYGHEWGNQGETPYSHTGYIDFGPDAKESRHTVHTDPTETDPRTDNCLRTVPKGALASVRLGNWASSYEAESITYDIDVDAEHQGVLIIKYAVVLQEPGTTCGDPGFKMVVLDENGEEIDENCGKADFSYSTAVDAGWNMTKEQSTTVAWKDWTTVGVNLQPYAGQTIKVRFTTYDCGGGGHFGYGYFVLDCANAHLETENCGNEAKIECYAPEGFSYAWYRGDPDEPGNDPFWFERELVVDPGRQEYTCRVSFLEDEHCYFDVSTVSAPRFPVADFTYERLYGQLPNGEKDYCSSRLKFHNTSHVMNKYDGTETHTQEPTNDCRWTFRRLSDGSSTVRNDWNAVYLCPPEGDSIEVTLWTYIGTEESPCDTIKVDTIVVPNIIPESTEFHWSTCPDKPVKFGGQWFQTDTIYVGYFPNFANCDSTSTLYLNVWPEIPDTYRHDSICSDGYVIIDGIKYNQPMDNQQFVLRSVHGCDSIVFATLTVNERIDAEVNSIPFVCADDGQMYLTFDIAAGQFDSLAISFNTRQLRDTVIYDPTVSTVAIPYPDTITPGHYTATFEFYQFCCGIYKETRDIELRYSSSIVAQKWNDVLTLLAPAYNGGYEFTAFQWYKNGQPIPGETHSYLYQDLDRNALYHVELTRPDGVVIGSCPIQPTYHEQQSDYPTIAKAAQRMPVYSEQSATVWYFTMSGQLYGTCTLPQGYGTLDIPAQPGVYILKAVTSQGQTQAQVLLVE